MRITPPLFNTNNVVEAVGRELRVLGSEVHPERWQGVDAPAPMLELLEASLRTSIPPTPKELVSAIKPNLPWAEDHFQERVSGVPFNPPPSAEYWPFNPSSFEFREDKKYTHTYPERMWPKTVMQPHSGIRYPFGDLDDVVALLQREPSTRQAFLPIWFPEDTGAVHGGRVPCTLGYLFRVRDGYMHITYYIRSCDYFRHFRDDIYMAGRLLQWMIDATGLEVQPGCLNMYMGSLHCWLQERELLPR